jgi:hypothetical protein
LLPEWQRCLSTHEDNELAVHQFLEQHPCLLPGGESDSTSIGGHHGPFPGAVISQPQLFGTFRRQPDFIWPTKVSGVFMPVLLELERPDKRWFRQDGQQTEELSQAINQVAEWRTWLDSDANQLLFYEVYGISSWIKAYHKVEPVFRLAYGRRSEFIDDPKLTRHRESIRPDWLEWSTYDRLAPSAGARRWVTVRIKQGVGWEVVAVPPTFDLALRRLDDLQGLVGLSEAIQANDLMSDDRKTYLLERVSTIQIKPAAEPKLWERYLRDVVEPDMQESDWQEPDWQERDLVEPDMQEPDLEPPDPEEL